MTRYTVITSHHSEYPEPIRLRKGDVFSVGEKYEGPEDWDNWFFCITPHQPGGWVPKQVIAMQSDGTGMAVEDYCARELDVEVDEALEGTRVLNGWVWCLRPAHPEDQGWVPLENLRAISTPSET